MTLMQRRRALMGKGAEPTGTLMFGPVFHFSNNGGTGSNDGNLIRMVSTNSARWQLNCNPATNYTTISALLGHTIKVIVKNLEWLNKPSGANLAFCFGGYTGSPSVSITRQAYFAIPAANGTDYFTISQNIFDRDSSKYSDSHMFLWQAYLYSNSGGDVKFEIEVYDMGV